MADRYMKVLRKIMTDDTPAQPTTKTFVEIASEIEKISGMLRGPLHSSERLLLVEERIKLRKQLEQVK